MKRAEGQISVFLALCGILIFALICTCLESARMSALEHLMHQAAGSSMQSVFAGYHRELAGGFGLLARDTGRSEAFVESTLKAYAGKYLYPDVAAGSLPEGTLQAELMTSVYLTDDAGYAFLDNVLAYMRTGGLFHVVDSALQKMGLRGSSEASSVSDMLKGLLADRDLSPNVLTGQYGDVQREADKYWDEQEKSFYEAWENSLAPEPAEPPEGGPTPPEGTAPGDDEAPPEPPEPPAFDRPAGKLEHSFINRVRSILSQGLLRVFMNGRDISQAVWPRENLPSVLPENIKRMGAGRSASNGSFDEKLFLTEYIMHYMGNCLSPSPLARKYEMEYILSGKEQESECLLEVAMELLLLRSGLNLMYLLTDAQKLELTELTALATTSAFGVPFLTKPLQGLLLTAWSMAEGIIDVRCLLEGKSIPLRKTTRTWQVQLSGSFLDESYTGNAGLTYQDYLRLLFYMKPCEKILYRTMDVITLHVRLKDSTFRMEACMTQASATLTAEFPFQYIAFPAFRRMVGGSGAGGKSICVRTAFGYR